MKKKSTVPSLSLKKVSQGFILSAQSRHLSIHTINDYLNTLKKFIDYIGENHAFETITHRHVEGFLASVTHVTNKTLLNYHTGLSAMWTWAVREHLAETHVVHMVTPPKPEKREIMPFSEEEVKLLLHSVTRSKVYQRAGQRQSDRGLPHAYRMRAIILLLLDTGLRASELTGMQIHQVDRVNSRVQVMGKGSLERSIPMSPRTAQAIWRYLATRENPRTDEPLFVTTNGRAIDRTSLGKMLAALGVRAGVKNVHPHRFRHTFAIQYLRNNGDPYTLQRNLGHSTLDMVRVYLQLSQVDMDKAHRRASPVDNWGL